MRMSINSVKVWDDVWSDPNLVTDDIIILEAERATIRWSRIVSRLMKEFGSLKNLKVIEIGSGIGTYAALLASEGAKSTLLDFSPKALKRAKDFFSNNTLKAKYFQGDALDLPAEILKTKFDISISVGLTEHFKGKDRIKINNQHFKVLKKGGIAIIIVPNKYNPPYRLYKYCSELFGTWKFGEEYPYSRLELSNFCHTFGYQLIGLFGDDLYQSIRFLLPANFLRRLFRVGTPNSLDSIHFERGTIIDDYLGYSLILMAKK